MSKQNKNIKIYDISASAGEAPNSILKAKKGKDSKKNKKKKIIIASVFVLLIAGVAGYLLWPSSVGPESVPNKQEDKKSPYDTESPLNGVLTTEEIAQRRPLGAMIENHTDSRPQSGLDKADLVYEMVTEGGITRFLAFYVIYDVSEIGPVRSAREPFVDFAKEYNACYAHVGGSDTSLNMINSSINFCDLNQFSLGKYFWRDRTRYAPHNVYTATDKLREAAKSKNYSLKADYTPWGFKDDAKEEERGDTQEITINFSSTSFLINYAYDKKSNSYLRRQGGVAHKDKNTGVQISPKTVIVQEVSSYREGQYTNINYTTSGKATIYMDGNVIKGSWKKLSRESRAKFYDDNGKEIAFTRGQIWIEVATSVVTHSSN